MRIKKVKANECKVERVRTLLTQSNEIEFPTVNYDNFWIAF